MKKSTLVKRNLNMRGLLPIAAGFMLMPTFVFAQTEKQIQVIKKETNVQGLQQLQKGLRKSTLTTKQLKAKAEEKGLLYSGESNGQFFQLKGFDKKTGRPLYYVTTNVGASMGTGTNKLNSSAGIFNLDGEGMKVHEWDGGAVLKTHQEFGNRVTQKDQAQGANGHATHVAGTMIAAGVDPRAKGMAPKANLDAYDWTDDTIEMTEAAIDGALVSNHSYGFVSGFVWGGYSGLTGWHWVGSDDDTEYKYYGKYTDSDRDWDVIAQNAPYYLPVKAAGNPRGAGPEPGEVYYVQIYNEETKKWEWKESTKPRQKNGGELGFDTINHGALGKNILIVGAAEKMTNGYKAATDVKMASFSGFGPVDDGRIKPDITGIGVGLISSATPYDNSYASLSGTSMASPNVTGSLILLQEHYKNLNNGAFMKAATLRALVIGTANEAGDAPGPDYKSGWGLLNAHKAAVTISTNGKYALISEKTLRNTAVDKMKVVASGSEPLVVTLAWTDPAPKDLPSEQELNNRLATLVNDLDIKITKDGAEYLPWKLDPANPNNAATKGNNAVDNVEQVVIEEPEAGATYEIEISHKGDLKKNKIIYNADGTMQVDLEKTTIQEYSLVITGVDEGVGKDLGIKSIKVPVPNVEYTSETPVLIEVENKGMESLSGAVVKYEFINASTGGVVSSGNLAIDSIEARTTKTLQVKVDLTESFVDFKFVATVEVEGDEIDVNNRDEITIHSYLVDVTSPDKAFSYGFEQNLPTRGFTSEDVNGDGKTWMRYTDPALSYAGNSFALNFPGETAGTDDWMYSNPFKVKGGETYRVSFFASKFQPLDENVSAYWGTSPNKEAMTNLFEKIEIPTEPGDYKRYVYEFVPQTDGIIYLGFHNKVDADKISYAVAIDNLDLRYAKGKPMVDFRASKVNPNTFEMVDLVGDIVTTASQPVISQEWVVEPSTFDFVEGTDKNSANPKIIFNKEGAYNITLKATNSQGETVETKNGYIVAKNTPAVARFTNTLPTIYEGEVVKFRNTSIGNPMPTEFKWTITPSEGVEFVNGTTSATRDAEVKFTQAGQYTVELEATSKVNTAKVRRENLVTVRGVHNAVKNIEGAFSEDKVSLTWERPLMNPDYEENFGTGVAVAPEGVTIINGGDERSTWVVQSLFSTTGNGLMNQSWYLFDHIDTDDWFVSPRIRSGAELLTYSVAHRRFERYDVYIVEAEEGREITPEYLKTGHKVYSFDGKELTGSFGSFVKRKIDIKDYTGKDFYLAFHHRTKKEDEGYELAIDDILVGYDNEVATGKTTEEVRKTEKNVLMKLQEAKELVSYKDVAAHIAAPSEVSSHHKTTMAVLNLPRLTGYKVEKVNTGVVKETNDVADKRYDEVVTANGLYAYDVYALYSDGKVSEPKRVEVNVTNLSTSDVKNEGLKIYPNPSDGRFVVEAGSGVTSLKAEVYDMSGKQIYKQDFRGSKADLNLTQYPKGVYILNLVDNNGKKQSAKLMIK
ncbi:S8 family serine peptidase [Bergeyella porcorum]|uniref:S8 family serine peptidase n=1 Tax=Bergeyella porcorum TaxID=1735111 RepID=UPI0035E7DA2D